MSKAEGGGETLQELLWMKKAVKTGIKCPTVWQPALQNADCCDLQLHMQEHISQDQSLPPASARLYISSHQLLKQNVFWHVEYEQQKVTPLMRALKTAQAPSWKQSCSSRGVSGSDTSVIPYSRKKAIPDLFLSLFFLVRIFKFYSLQMFLLKQRTPNIT